MPRMCSSVDLPAPDGPMIDTNSPSLEVERDAAQHPRPARAVRVGLFDVAQRDQRFNGRSLFGRGAAAGALREKNDMLVAC